MRLARYQHQKPPTDFSEEAYFNEDAMIVAEPVQNFLATEGNILSLNPAIIAIMEGILESQHGLDNQPAIYNIAMKLAKLLFGIGVEQELVPPHVSRTRGNSVYLLGGRDPSSSYLPAGHISKWK